MRVGVFHPGTQHSWQTALAFQEAGALGGTQRPFSTIRSDGLTNWSGMSREEHPNV